MKRFAFLALFASAVSSASAQTIAEQLATAKDAYKNNNFEQAKALFASIIVSNRAVSTDQKVTAYTYLGAYWASQPQAGARDSAKNYFLSALDYDAFAVLDPTLFSAEELGAFALASASTFRIGVKPVQPKAIEPGGIYNFRIVATRTARVVVTITKLNTNNPVEEQIFQNGSVEGQREVPWGGLINNQRADTGIYELKLAAYDLKGNATVPVNETQRFRIEHVFEKLEDSLPPFKDVNQGGTDTLRSRYSAFKPFTDGGKGILVGLAAAGLPLVASIPTDNMSRWGSHYGIGISIGTLAGFGAGYYAMKHRDDSRAARENERRKRERAQFNAGVKARNDARLNKTILIIKPLTSAGITG